MSTLDDNNKPIGHNVNFNRYKQFLYNVYLNQFQNKMGVVFITIMILTVVVRFEMFISHTNETVHALEAARTNELMLRTKVEQTVPSVPIVVSDSKNSSNSSSSTKSDSNSSSNVSPTDVCANGNCDMAFTDSYGFFDDIPNEAWLHKKHITTKVFPSWYLYPSNPEIMHDHTSPHWFGFNVHPMFSCDYVTRVGGYGDGGKFLCDIHRVSKKKECLIYSIGSNGQYEFEEDMQKQLSEFSQRPWDPNPNKVVPEPINHYPCEIHIFDPSPNYGGQASAEKNMYYHAWGIKTDIQSTLMDGADASTLQFFTFEETLQKLNHTKRHIDVFKIDCEGCEWSGYTDILNHSDQITQMQIEIHPQNSRPADVTYPKFMNAFRENHWIPFYREPNPFDGRVIEYCFIRLRNFYNDIDKLRNK